MRRTRWAWRIVATLVCCAALVAAFDGFWGASWRAFVPLPTALHPHDPDPTRRLKPIVEADYRLAVWAVGRNAYTLLHAPTQLFQAEPCHPSANALALHHPVISPALIAAPVFAITSDPVATFDAAVFLKIAIGFTAMFLLLTDWTRAPAAGIVAGLLYAFHPSQIEHPYHLFTSDNGWMLFGLYFAHRLFQHHRWSDAVGLSAACLLQMGASFYPLLGAALTSLPLLLWLGWHHRHRPLPLAQALFVLGVAGIGAALLFAPYLDQASASFHGRGKIFYASWAGFLPGGKHFLGWSGGLLLLSSFVLGRRRTLAGISGDPRLALAIAALLVAFVATGGNYNARLVALTGAPPPGFELPNLFAALSRVLPGLSSVRLPGELALVTREISCILAGLGAAALLRVLPQRWFNPAAAVLILMAFLEMLPVPLPGLASEPPFSALRIRPDDGAISFFAALERAGNRGPLLEVPVDRDDPGYAFRRAPEEQLLSAYHHRRTSGCYVSFIPQTVRDLGALSRDLPDRDALARARALGFTTVVVHHDAAPGGPELERRFRSAAASGEPQLELLLDDPRMSAWILRDRER